MTLEKWRLLDSECEKLNPDYDPWFLGSTFPDVDKWIFVGFVPLPKTKPSWFIYHLIHGMAMGYPLKKVILYCLDAGNYPPFRK